MRACRVCRQTTRIWGSVSGLSNSAGGEVKNKTKSCRLSLKMPITEMFGSVWSIYRSLKMKAEHLHCKTKPLKWIYHNTHGSDNDSKKNFQFLQPLYLTEVVSYLAWPHQQPLLHRTQSGSANEERPLEEVWIIHLKVIEGILRGQRRGRGCTLDTLQ